MTVFGLMTHRSRRIERYAVYAEEAARAGFECTVLFTPRDVDLKRKRLTGFRYDNGRWIRCVSRLPDIVHDFGFYSAPRTIRRVKTIKSPSFGLPFTGYALGHKWEIHRRLSRTPYAAYLPETAPLCSPGQPLAWLERFGTIVVKPRNGKQGKGIVKIHKLGSGRTGCTTFLWKEGDRRSRRLCRERLLRKLWRRFAPRKAILQRWMDIRSPKGGVFDIRALVQKTEGDVWRLTEMAVRQSGVGHIAANVSRGGTAASPYGFLVLLYGEPAAESIVRQCRDIAAGLPGELEKQYGKRFAELGIDLAVERGGRVRLIEINIKPGKKIVRALSGEEAYADAVVTPVRYAKWLSDRRDSLWTGSSPQILPAANTDNRRSPRPETGRPSSE
mgnify:CR=1 FL=1